MTRVERLAGCIAAFFAVYVAGLEITPPRCFDDTAKLFNIVHFGNARLHAHGLPSLRAAATCTVMVAVLLLLWMVRDARPALQLRAVAIPLVALAIAEAAKLALPRPSAGWEPTWTATASYPSAHVAAGAGYLLAAWVVAPTARRRPVVVAAIAAIMVLVVASAQHRPLDAVGGTIVAHGAAIAFGPERVNAADGGRFARAGAAIVAAIAVAAVAAVVTPTDVFTQRYTDILAHRSAVNVAMVLHALLALAVATATVEISASAADSRSAAAPGTSAPSPRGAASH